MAIESTRLYTSACDSIQCHTYNFNQPHYNLLCIFLLFFFTNTNSKIISETIQNLKTENTFSLLAVFYAIAYSFRYNICHGYGCEKGCCGGIRMLFWWRVDAECSIEKSNENKKCLCYICWRAMHIDTPY